MSYRFSITKTMCLGSLSFILAACGGEGGGASTTTTATDNPAPAATTPTPTPTSTPTPPATVDVTISGKASFDHVPHFSDRAGLDYSALTSRPIRGARIAAINETGAIISETTSSKDGHYELTVPSAQDVRIRVYASLETDGSPELNIVDNTNDNLVYVLDGSLTSSGDASSTRHLHAPSGWDGARYSQVRAAAPFAIMDTVYAAMDQIRNIDSDVTFPPLSVGWSSQNIANVPVPNFGIEFGNIGTSSYVNQGEYKGMILILGSADFDADEYDPHVILHEWAHYFEHNLSRSDSLGGAHSLHTPLDPRVAMSEGLASALAGLILSDSLYRDSRGMAQAQGFSFDLESDRASHPGWFSESSVQQIIYDLGDHDAENHDNISLGLGPIYNALTSKAYRQQESFATIFSLLAQIREDMPEVNTMIDQLITAEKISGQGYHGEGETNAGNLTNTLPLYKTVEADQSGTLICSSSQIGVFNKLGNRNYVSLNVAQAGSYQITAQLQNGPNNANPVIRIFSTADMVTELDASSGNSEMGVIDLAIGRYRVEAYDVLKLSGGFTQESCFDLSVTAL